MHAVNPNADELKYIGPGFLDSSVGFVPGGPPLHSRAVPWLEQHPPVCDGLLPWLSPGSLCMGRREKGTVPAGGDTARSQAGAKTPGEEGEKDRGEPVPDPPLWKPELCHLHRDRLR